MQIRFFSLGLLAAAVASVAANTVAVSKTNVDALNTASGILNGAKVQKIAKNLQANVASSGSGLLSRRKVADAILRRRRANMRRNENEPDEEEEDENEADENENEPDEEEADENEADENENEPDEEEADENEVNESSASKLMRRGNKTTPQTTKEKDEDEEEEEENELTRREFEEDEDEDEEDEDEEDEEELTRRSSEVDEEETDEKEEEVDENGDAKDKAQVDKQMMNTDSKKRSITSAALSNLPVGELLGEDTDGEGANRAGIAEGLIHAI